MRGKVKARRIQLFSEGNWKVNKEMMFLCVSKYKILCLIILFLKGIILNLIFVPLVSFIIFPLSFITFIFPILYPY